LWWKSNAPTQADFEFAIKISDVTGFGSVPISCLGTQTSLQAAARELLMSVSVSALSKLVGAILVKSLQD
jgi:hypothetical protein